MYASIPRQHLTIAASGPEACRQALEDAARKHGVRLENPGTVGRRFRFTLRPIAGQPNPYQRISASAFGNGRRVAAVCWHGHRDVLRAAFERLPMMQVQAGSVVYRGAEHFEETYRDTADRNIGSQMRPVYWPDACTCPDAGSWE